MNLLPELLAQSFLLPWDREREGEVMLNTAIQRSTTKNFIRLFSHVEPLYILCCWAEIYNTATITLLSNDMHKSVSGLSWWAAYSEVWKINTALYWPKMELPQQFLQWVSWTGLSSSCLQLSWNLGPLAGDHTGPEPPQWCLGSGTSQLSGHHSEAAKTEGECRCMYIRGLFTAVAHLV